MGEIDDIRKRAWETRRQKYGQRGHAGSYSRATSPCPSCRGAVALLIRLLSEGALSEGQVAKATGLDRITIRRMEEEHAACPSVSPSVAGRG